MVKVLFIGGKEKGYISLKRLLQMDCSIVNVFIMQEEAHEEEKFSDKISALCQIHRIPYVIKKTVKYDLGIIKDSKPDVIFVIGWRSIIPYEIISLPSLGTIAFHESLLPRYRGFAPINWAIINGEKETGVTMFYLNKNMDEGDIIAQVKFTINKNDTAYTIYKKTIEITLQLLNENFKKIVTNKAPRKKQNNANATYTCLRTPEDGRIDWRKSAYEIHDFVRAAAFPYPGAFCFLENKKIGIEKTEISLQKNWGGSIPGRVISIDKERGIEVLCGSGSLFIKAIKVSKKIVNPASYITSIKQTLT